MALLRNLHPEWFGLSGGLLRVLNAFTRGQTLPAALARHLLLGDARAAVVISARPHLVAAYTDELDAVAVVRVPGLCRQLVPLDVGARLITVNLYRDFGPPATDVQDGPRSTGSYVDFCPIIAAFVSRDHQRMDKLKSDIEPWEWKRAARMGSYWLEMHGAARARDGRPGWSVVPIDFVRR